MKLKIVPTVVLLTSMLFFSTLLAATELSEEIILEKLSLFEKASRQSDKAFFENNFDIDARVTIHSKQRESKHTVEFSKQDVIDGKLQKNSSLLDELERVKTDITFYNNNTQALLAYTMRPKKGSNFRQEKGYSVETEMLFQIIKGEIKIMKVIAHIDMEPNYQASVGE